MQKDGERIDDLQYRGMRLIQSPHFPSFTMDSVLLANFCRACAHDAVVDLGAGTGVLPVLLNARTGAICTALEVVPELCDMLRRSIALNNQQDSIRVLNIDLVDAPASLGYGAFSCAVCNPPYFTDASASPNPARCCARHEIACSLPDIARTAFSLLNNGGSFYMVLPARRLVDAAVTLRQSRLEPKELQFVLPQQNAAPSLLLLRAKKLAQPGLQVLPPLVLFRADGSYTEELRAIYHMEEPS